MFTMPEQDFDLALKGAEHILNVRLPEKRNNAKKTKFLKKLLGIRLQAALNNAHIVQQLHPSLSESYNRRLKKAQKLYEELE